jgi:tetratricopeptide (TPR) repeat protein
MTGKIAQAINCHKKSRKIASACQKLILHTSDMDKLKLKLRRCEIAALLNIGLCKIDLWELEEAVNLFQEVSSLPETNDYLSEPILNCWFCLAFLYSSLGLKQRAKYFAEKSELLLNPIDKPQTEWATGNRLFFLAITYKNLENTTKSFKMYHRAIAYAEESQYPQVRAKALYGLAELYRKQGDFEAALSHHSEAIELLDKIGAKCDLAEAYYQLGLTYQKIGEVENSQVNFDKAIRLFNEMEAPKQVEKVRKAMESGE